MMRYEWVIIAKVFFFIFIDLILNRRYEYLPMFSKTLMDYAIISEDCLFSSLRLQSVQWKNTLIEQMLRNNQPICITTHK